MFFGGRSSVGDPLSLWRFLYFALPLSESTLWSNLSRFRPHATASLKAVSLALALLVVSGCASRFDRYNVGTAELWIGWQVLVHQECTRRGVVTYSNEASIFGCTDFKERVVISVADPKVIAHEWCHWATRSDNHDVCPTPLVRLH